MDDPYAYLNDVLTRLPTQRASEIGQLLPHPWQPVKLRKTVCLDAYAPGAKRQCCTKQVGLEQGRKVAQRVA